MPESIPTTDNPNPRPCSCNCPAHHGRPRTGFNDAGCRCTITCASQPLTVWMPDSGAALFCDTAARLRLVTAGPDAMAWNRCQATDTSVDGYTAFRIIHRLLHQAADTVLDQEREHPSWVQPAPDTAAILQRNRLVRTALWTSSIAHFTPPQFAAIRALVTTDTPALYRWAADLAIDLTVALRDAHLRDEQQHRDLAALTRYRDANTTIRHILDQAETESWPPRSGTTAARIRQLLDTTDAADPDHNTSDRPLDGPAIRWMLDLATSHLPADLGTNGLMSAPGVTAYPTDNGFLMWVPDDPDDSHLAMVDPVPAAVLTIQRYASHLDCDYVIFAADAPEDSALPTWTW